jgi:catechol 2,3-dioxygenase-like lactoylglutathione lyase family enzyme
VLGRFLEYSVPTPDIGASLEFYTKLGFSMAETGEAWRYPYAVVTDGRIHLGLHQHPLPAPSLTFVRPDLLRHLAALEALGITFEFCRLGNDVFNELGWFDPSGHLLRLVEARTFSPTKRAATEISSCGYFLEMALPTSALEDSKAFWEKLGFVGLDETGSLLPHVSCTSDSIDIGLYAPADMLCPALLYDAGDVGGALARLAAAGIEPSGRPPGALRHGPAAVLTAPEGTAILLIPETPAVR